MKEGSAHGRPNTEGFRIRGHKDRPQELKGIGSDIQMPGFELPHALETSQFSSLPERTRRFLSAYEYKGVKPVELPSPDAAPGIVFLTADIKVPEEGDPKILEFNGVGSQLEAYPDGENVAVDHIYKTLQSLDLPVYALTIENTDTMDFQLTNALNKFGGANIKTGVDASLIGVNVEDGSKHGIQYVEDPFLFAPRDEVSPRLSDLRMAEGVVWSQYDELPPDLDEGRFVVINPDRIEKLIKNKDEFGETFTDHGLAHLRPRSWALSKKDPMPSVEEILADADGIDKLVLKPTDGTGGKGIVTIEKANLAERIKQIFVDPFDEDDFLAGQRLPVEAWLRKVDGNFMVEEYVASKPVISEADGQAYDGTLRIAFMGITNQGKMTVVPICSYWKLPSEPLGQEWNEKSTISNGYNDNPSTVVSPEDFSKAFASLSEAMPTILEDRP